MVQRLSLLIFMISTVLAIRVPNACEFTMQTRQECIAARGGAGVVPVTYGSVDGNQEVSLERDRMDIWPDHLLTVHSYFPNGFASFTYGSCNFDEQTSIESCGSCKTTSKWAPGDWKCETLNPSRESRFKTIQCDFMC